MSEPVKSRAKITVTTVKPVEEKQGQKGPYKLLKFQAKNEQGQEGWYSSFHQSLFEAIKPEAVLDADIESKETEYGMNRLVTQVYVDGQPLAGQKQGTGGYSGRQWQPKDPLDRQSIEFQVAMKEAGESLRAGVIAKDSTIAHLYYGALISLFERQGIKPNYQEQPSPKAQSVSGAAPGVQTPPAVSGRKFANIGAVLQQAWELGKIDSDACMKEWKKVWPSLNDPSQIKSPDIAWATLVKAKLVPE